MPAWPVHVLLSCHYRSSSIATKLTELAATADSLSCEAAAAKAQALGAQGLHQAEEARGAAAAAEAQALRVRRDDGD